MEAILLTVLPVMFYVVMIAVTGRVVYRAHKWGTSVYSSSEGEREVISALWGFAWPLVLPAMLAIAAMRVPSAREREVKRIQDAAAAEAARKKGLARAEQELREATSQLVQLRPREKDNYGL